MITLDPTLPASADRTYEFPLSLDLAMRRANPEGALLRYQHDSDTSRLDVPADATRVVMRPLTTAEHDRVVESVGDPPRLALVLDEQLSEELAALDEQHRADLEAIPDPMLKSTSAADVKRRRVAVLKHQQARAKLVDVVTAAWQADPELAAARSAMNQWHQRRKLALIEACVVRVEPRAELADPEHLGPDAEAERWPRALIRRWLDLIPPVARRHIEQEVYLHAERLCNLGKAPAAASSSRPGSPTTSAASGGARTASTTRRSGARGGTAAARSRKR